MAIDRIGKPGVPPATGSLSSPGVGASEPFSVDGPAEASVPGASGDAASPAFEQLRAGSISIDRYLDLKVDEATAHLGPAGAPELQAIRESLRERLATDPTFVDLVRSATGGVPSPRSGDD